MAQIERLDDEAGLARLLDRSHAAPVWIFKHSLTCPVSAVARAEFERFAAAAPAKAAFAVLEVQRTRSVSEAVVRLTGIPHETPQALLLREGRVVWHASHWAVDLRALQRAPG